MSNLRHIKQSLLAFQGPTRCKNKIRKDVRNKAWGKLRVSKNERKNTTGKKILTAIAGFLPFVSCTVLLGPPLVLFLLIGVEVLPSFGNQLCDIGCLEEDSREILLAWETPLIKKREARHSNLSAYLFWAALVF